MINYQRSAFSPQRSVFKCSLEAIERCKKNVVLLSFRLVRNLSSEGLPTSGSDRLEAELVITYAESNNC